MFRRLRDALVILAMSGLLLALLEGGARLSGIGAPDLPPIPPKAAGSFRIVAVGGSTVLGVPDGVQGFVAQLERGLRRAAPGRPLEVVNLARSGAPSSEVRAALSAALDADPDLLILLTGHNEFLAPPPSVLQRVRDASWLVRALTRRFAPGPAVEDPFPDALVAVDRKSAAFRRRVARFRENLDAMVSQATSAGVPLLLCTAPSNLADWPPAHRRVRWPGGGAGRTEAETAVYALLERGPPESALTAARDALTRYPDDAWLNHLEGRALSELGRFAKARELFERARDLDPIPRRAFGSFNDAVRAHVDTPGVRVVDVARIFEGYAEHGLVGFELVGDNCHPTPLGNAIIARALAAAMAEQGLFLPRGTSIPALGTWRAQLEKDLGDPEARRGRQLRWLLSNALYAMKTPFFDYEASRRYLVQARALSPGDWRVFANLATLDLLQGDLHAGRRALHRARVLRGAPLDPDDRRVTPYLKEALAQARIALPRAGAGGS